MKSPIPITIIGAGRLAWSLIPNLQKKGFLVNQLISRNTEQLAHFQTSYHIPHISTLVSAILPETRVIFITVSDSAIPEIAAQIHHKEALILHTSGSVALDCLAIAGNNIGVFYPLQIFTFDKVTHLDDAPIYYEVKQKENLFALQSLAAKISSKSIYTDSEQRLKIHLGAVFACNFTNFMYRIAADLLPKGTSFSVYKPLIEEQISKAFLFSPEKSQTGPALRKDTLTIQKHLALLNNQKAFQALYKEISQLIQPELDM